MYMKETVLLKPSCPHLQTHTAECRSMNTQMYISNYYFVLDFLIFEIRQDKCRNILDNLFKIFLHL